MTSHESEVLALVRSGKITEAEAVRLRRAMNGRSERWRVLVDPMTTLTPRLTWLAGVIIIAACVLSSRWAIRFDGALDVHQALHAPSWMVAAFDQINAIALTAVVLWTASLAVAKRGRIIDFIQAVTLARGPLLPTVALISLTSPSDLAVAGVPDTRLLVVAFATLPLLVWFIVLLYRGFAVSSGLKGPRAAATFSIALVVAEVITKCALWALSETRYL